jgi:hypothetical protein
MKTSKSLLALFCAILLSSLPAIAADTKTEISKEIRTQMADMHEKMAACLKSEKPFADCRTEMQTSCMGEGHEACAMMGADHMKGMRHGKGKMGKMPSMASPKENR